MNSKDEDRINIKCNFINDYFNTTETEYAEIIAICQTLITHTVCKKLNKDNLEALLLFLDLSNDLMKKDVISNYDKLVNK